MDVLESDSGPVNGSSLSYHCNHCDKELVHKIAKQLLRGLAAACVDSTTGLFKAPASVAVILRQEMVEYLKQRSGMHNLEAVAQGDDSATKVGELSGDPPEIISVLLHDFARLKRNFFSRVSGWLSSESREGKIDDFAQEMDRNAFWSLDTREPIAEILISNVDLESTYHCSLKFDFAQQLEEHKNQCTFRTVNCRNDGCDAQFSAFHVEIHDSLCPFKLIPCAQKCSGSIMRSEMDRHVITDCPMKLMSFPFYKVGCQTSLPQGHFENQCSIYIQSHLLCVLETLHNQEALVEELRRRLQLLGKSQSLNELSGSLETRSQKLAIKEQEAKMKKLERDLSKVRHKTRLHEECEVMQMIVLAEDNLGILYLFTYLLDINYFFLLFFGDEI